MTFPVPLKKCLRRGATPAFVSIVPQWPIVLWTAVFAMLLLATTARADLLVLESGYSGHGPGLVSRVELATGESRPPLLPMNESCQAMTTAPDGSIYVTANLAGYGMIYRYDANGTLLGTCGDVAHTQFEAVAAGPGNALYLIAAQHGEGGTSSRTIVRAPASGTKPPLTLVPEGAGGMFAPVALALGPDGIIYVADLVAGVLKFDAQDGAFAGVLAAGGEGGLREPTAVACGPDGTVYVGTASSAAVLRFDANTGLARDPLAAPDANGPAGVRALAFGPDRQLYALAVGQHEVWRLDPGTGAATRVATNPRWARPSALAIVGAAQRAPVER